MERSFLFQLLSSHLAAELSSATRVQLVHWPFHEKKEKKILLSPRTLLAVAAQKAEEENPALKEALVQGLEITAGKL